MITLSVTVETKVCIADKTGWTYGKTERRDNTENICDKGTRRLQKTRKATAKMGGLKKKEEEETLFNNITHD